MTSEETPFARAAMMTLRVCTENGTPLILRLEVFIAWRYRPRLIASIPPEVRTRRVGFRPLAIELFLSES
jgi:hypothetical protein